ncbi:MAG: RecX family transcriptional regulator [Candidatus Shapirobacteria bacterium]|nr:RecX family transcriptional regulator [Candidatus Shapirobacteria bacterium]
MQIVSIKTSKIPNQVWITFSDSSFIPFFIDDIVKLSLAKNQEIDDSKLETIIKNCLLFKGKEYALRQIAISPKTEKIINQKIKIFLRKIILKYKLNISGLNLTEINQEIIDYLKVKKLLNDLDFINYFVKKNHKKSRQQIIYLLQQHGVDRNLLSQINFTQENDLTKIKSYLNKKNIDISKIKDFKEKNKIKSALFRRGFNISDINIAIDDYDEFR